MFATRIDVVDFDVDAVVVLAKCKTKTFVFVRSLVSSFSRSFILSHALFFHLFDFHSFVRFSFVGREVCSWIGCLAPNFCFGGKN